MLDLFLGSDSTLIAAHRVGRICPGIEIDPLYVDLAVRRWQRDTGEQAVLAQTGERFEDIAAALRKRAMADAADPADRVGYKRPPRATRFNPGQSGNSKGGPRARRTSLRRSRSS